MNLKVKINAHGTKESLNLIKTMYLVIFLSQVSSNEAIITRLIYTQKRASIQFDK